MAYTMQYSSGGGSSNSSYDPNKWKQMWGEPLNRWQQQGTAYTQGAQANMPWTSAGYNPAFQAQQTDVNNYMSNVLGTQKNLMNQYANQAAGAGVAASRGGFGVQGGVNQASNLFKQGAAQLASGTAQNYQNAMQNAQTEAARRQALWGTQAGLGLNYGQLEAQGLSGASSYDQNLWNRWQTELNNQLEREKLTEDTRRWNLQWQSGQEDRSRAWDATQDAQDQARWARQNQSQEDSMRNYYAGLSVPFEMENDPAAAWLGAQQWKNMGY